MSPLATADLAKLEMLLRSLSSAGPATESGSDIAADTAASGDEVSAVDVQGPRELVWFVRPGFARFPFTEEQPAEVYHP